MSAAAKETDEKPETALATITPEVVQPVLEDAEPTGTLSVVEQREADKAFLEQVEKFKDRDKSALKVALKVQWDKGQFLLDLQSKPRHWGNHTTEQFAEAMNVSVQLAYAYAKFASKYTAAQVDQLIEWGINWGNVFYLVSVEDTKVREQLTLRSSKVMAPKGKYLDSRQLQAEIKAVNAKSRAKKNEKGQKVDNRGGVAPATVFKSTVSMCSDLQRKIVEFRDAYKEFGKVDAGSPRKSELGTLLKNARKAMESTNSKLQAALEFSE